MFRKRQKDGVRRKMKAEGKILDINLYLKKEEDREESVKSMLKRMTVIPFSSPY
jgi:hypothetical protein